MIASMPGGRTGILKSSLVQKYRTVFLDRLTPGELSGPPALPPKEYRSGRWDPEQRRKFAFRLRTFFPKSVLSRDIAGIEALLTLLSPGDLAGEGRA